MMITKPRINLDEKTPEELRSLLNLVQTGPLPVDEKEIWIREINSRLNGKTLDIEKAIQISRDIEEGMADIDDIGN